MSVAAPSRVGIVGAAGVPHAPQFWSMPDTEDRQQVADSRSTMREVGKRLQELDPDVLIIVGNDHSENFYRACIPSFVVHCGAAPGGTYGDRSYGHKGAPDQAYALVRQLQRQGFDPAYSAHAMLSYAFGIPLEFCEISAELPIIPIFVNAYFPPQPLPERCWAFGAALQDACKILGIRAVVLASGGLSHFPGTNRYESPDFDTDERLMDELKAGRTRSMLDFDLYDLDRTGNSELLPWLVAGGAIGQKVPDITGYVPSWHHTYAVVGWTKEDDQSSVPEKLYYPPTGDAETLCAALHALRFDVEGACDRYMADPASIADEFGLGAAERSALFTMDPDQLRAAGAHPMLLGGAIRSLVARGFQVG
jgi:2,3-dihydroxyphenylpropionate 1,2-dioxygenase